MEMEKLIKARSAVGHSGSCFIQTAEVAVATIPRAAIISVSFRMKLYIASLLSGN